MVSTRGRYALRVMIDLAEHNNGKFIPLKDIAERQEISEKYLESIVKSLTKADVLEGLRGVHPAVDKVLRYRTLTKLRSTYCEGLLKAITADGRIHSSFNQTETRTGRISSTEPNLQNIPVRTPLGREFRRFFIAKEGNVLVDAD